MRGAVVRGWFLLLSGLGLVSGARAEENADHQRVTASLATEQRWQASLGVEVEPLASGGLLTLSPGVSYEWQQTWTASWTGSARFLTADERWRGRWEGGAWRLGWSTGRDPRWKVGVGLQEPGDPGDRRPWMASADFGLSVATDPVIWGGGFSVSKPLVTPHSGVPSPWSWGLALTYLEVANDVLSWGWAMLFRAGVGPNPSWSVSASWSATWSSDRGYASTALTWPGGSSPLWSGSGGVLW